MSPHCRMKRWTAGGSFFLSVISVITEISDKTGRMSRADARKMATVAIMANGCEGTSLFDLQDHAIGRGPAVADRGAGRHQRGDGPLQRRKLGKPVAQGRKMPFRELARLAAGG